jgi:hypothetical protein
MVVGQTAKMGNGNTEKLRGRKNEEIFMRNGAADRRTGHRRKQAL